MLTVDSLKTFAVLGAGTMGHGIAQVVAATGGHVRLFDALSGAASAGITRIAKNLDKGVELGKVTPEDRAKIFARLHAVEDVAAAVAGADCVIEAIPEHLELKRELFATVDRHAADVGERWRCERRRWRWQQRRPWLRAGLGPAERRQLEPERRRRRWRWWRQRHHLHEQAADRRHGFA